MNKKADSQAIHEINLAAMTMPNLTGLLVAVMAEHSARWAAAGVPLVPVALPLPAADSLEATVGVFDMPANPWRGPVRTACCLGATLPDMEAIQLLVSGERCQDANKAGIAALRALFEKPKPDE